MHQTIVPNSGPKLKLVEAAEKLFAENGFEVVSVRDITQAAGGNVAAVNYHFGSRDGLIAIVMNRYITPINDARLARLDELETQWSGQGIPIEKLLEAIVLPLVERIQESTLSENLYCQLVGRILGLHGSLPAGIEGQLSVLINRLRKLLGKSLPWLTHEELVWRLHFTMGGLVHTLTHRGSLERLADGAAGSPDLATTVERFLKWAAAGLREGETLAAAELQPEIPKPMPQVSVAVVEPEPPVPIEAEEPALEDPEEPALEEPEEPAWAEPEPPAADGAASEMAVPALAEPNEEEKPEAVVKRRSKKADVDSPQVFFDF